MKPRQLNLFLLSLLFAIPLAQAASFEDLLLRHSASQPRFMAPQQAGPPMRPNRYVQNHPYAQSRFSRRAYREVSGYDNPNTFDVMDNPYFWARWGSELAPYTSHSVNQWWRKRTLDMPHPAW